MPYRKPPSKPRVICAPITYAFSVAYLSQIAHGMYLDLEDGFRLRTHLRRPSHDQSRAVLDVVKAHAALDPACFGLDDACAQLEGSTYVMADEARLHFCVDRMRQRSYREDLVDASGIPPQSRQTRSAEADALRATLPAPLNNR